MIHVPSKILTLVLLTIFCCSDLSFSQVHTLTAGTGSVLPGGTVNIPVLLSNDEGARGYSMGVAPSGTDGGPGTEALPYKTLAYACTHAKSNSIREYENVTGGTGGTQNLYDEVQGYASKELTITAVPSTTTFEIQLGTSAYAHTYVSGGTVRKADDNTLAVSNGVYNHSTGIL